MRETEFAVSVRSVSKSFRALNKAKAKRQVVFSEYSFRLEAGKVLGILGPSGCGKSSLLRLCAGIDNADHGDILVFGAPPLPQTRAGTIAVLSSENTLLPWRTALDNVALPLDLLGVDKSTRRSRCIELLEAIRIGQDSWSKRPHELSEGQRQRLRLAQALITKPDLLLLDEPFSNVDEGLRRILIKIVQVHLEGSPRRSGILVTHHAYEAAAMADHIFILSGEPATNRFSFPLDGNPSGRSRDYLDETMHGLMGRMLKLAEEEGNRVSVP